MTTSTQYLTHPEFDHPLYRYGFFTRHGGVSKGLYASLNGGLGSEDCPDDVKRNRDIAASAIGGHDDIIKGLYQTHSNHVVLANKNDHQRSTADGIITKESGITCVILTADCLPILFADAKTGIIAASHAGWRGAVSGIAQNTVEGMIHEGAKREQIKAVIGPAIQQGSYQVGADLFEEVIENHPNASQYFIEDPDHPQSRWYFDLPSFAQGLLTGIGIQTYVINADTYSDDRFFSHRRTCHKNLDGCGRLMSLIRLVPSS